MIESIPRTGFTVSDLEQAIEFYTGVLRFDLVDLVEVCGPPTEQLHGIFGLRVRVATLKLGQEVLELSEYLTPTGRPIPADSRSNDGWFQHVAIVVSDMEAAYNHLRKFRVRHVSTAPQTLPDWNKAVAGIQAFYFRDPDGHNLEIICYPPGKGDERWQGQKNLFLGIDHTAIAVSSTSTSLSFYRDLLGFKAAGNSTNYGPEQAYLSQVPGARVFINSLRCGLGAGIELLEYLRPRNGRGMPGDTQANDLWHWQTTLLTRNAEAAARRLREAGYPLVSSGVVEMGDPRLGFNRGFMVRDPDGHALRIVEQ